MAALTAILSLGLTTDSDEYRKVQRLGFRHGKHNGRTKGAFGLHRAKPHRSLYVGAPKA